MSLELLVPKKTEMQKKEGRENEEKKKSKLKKKEPERGASGEEPSFRMQRRSPALKSPETGPNKRSSEQFPPRARATRVEAEMLNLFTGYIYTVYINIHIYI